MKKLSLYMIALLGMVLAGCSDNNYDPEVGPQSYAPESPVQISDVSVTSTASNIVIADVYDEATAA